MQTLTKRTKETIQFAIDTPTEDGKIPFVITGNLTLGKDSCYFFSNTTSLQIDGKNVLIGEVFDTEDPATGDEFGLKVRLNIADTRKVFKPRNPAPESKSVDVGI